MTDAELNQLLEDEYLEENKRLDDIFLDHDPDDELIDELLEPDEEGWEMVKLCDTYIHSIEYLTFHEKTWLYMSRNNMTANQLAKELNVSKYVLSKCRANPSYNWGLAEKLINRCQEVGLPCPKELEALQATKLNEGA